MTRTKTPLQRWSIVATLCSCSFCNAYLIISIFPYAGYLVQWLKTHNSNGDSEYDGSSTISTAETAMYAGFLGTSFMAGRFVTAYFIWGHWADAYGRVWTLQMALLGSAMCSMALGLSRSWIGALTARTLLGACNGIMSNSKTLASEVHNDCADKLWELRTMGLVIGMRSWGMLVGPVAGGFLAEPLQQYESLRNVVQSDKQLAWLGWVLKRYPFLLPNLLGALLCMSSAVLLGLVVPETLNDPESPRDALYSWFTHCLCTKKKVDTACSETNAAPTEHSSLLPMQSKDEVRDRPSARRPPSIQEPVWKVALARQHMVLIWTFGMVASFIDEALPLYCMFYLSMNEAKIGTVISIAGMLFASLQYLVFSYITRRLGAHRVIWLSAFLGTVPTIFLGLASNSHISHHHSSRTLLLACTLALIKLFHSFFFTTMAMSVNKTVDTRQRAKLNALVMTGNSVGRGLGPLLAGTTVTLSLYCGQHNIPCPSTLIWGPVPLLFGLWVARKAFQLPDTGTGHERPNDSSMP